MKLRHDRRGVSAVEFAVIVSVMAGVLLPITDIGIAAVTYISAYQSLRDVAAYAMYKSPPDLTANLTTYYSGIIGPTWPANTSVTACGDTICATAPVAPTSLLFTRTITLTPIVFDVGCAPPTGCKVNYLQPIQ